MQLRDLLGKTIKKVSKKRLHGYSDEGFLRFDFTDGSHAYIVASYGSYSKDAEDEYPTNIDVYEDWGDLIDIEVTELPEEPLNNIKQ